MIGGPTTVSDRSERIERDDGPGDETVYATGRAGFRIYHADRECGYLAPTDNSIHELPRRLAQRRLKAPCKGCVLEAAKTPAGNGQDCCCPFCGESVGMLPDHLPCDDEQDGGEA